jgi:uncharacterized protein with HEPN domain
MSNVTEAEFVADEDLQAIAERRIEIIGEAVSHLSPEYRQAHQESGTS